MHRHGNLRITLSRETLKCRLCSLRARRAKVIYKQARQNLRRLTNEVSTMSAFQEESQQDRKSKLKPVLSVETVQALLATRWNLTATKIRQIDSYDDANFYCTTTSESATGVVTDRSVLVKFYNAIDTEFPDILHGLAHMLARINENVKTSIQVPSVIQPIQPIQKSSDDASIAAANFVFVENCAVSGGTQETVAVRVFTWISGTTLSRVTPTLDLMVQLGRGIGDVTVALSGFDHPAFHRFHLWDLTQLGTSMPLIDYVDSPAVRECIRSIHHAFKTQVEPVSQSLPRAVIMADCNDANVIVTEAEPYNVTGLIDFSDAVNTWRVNEIAIAMAYSLLTSYGNTQRYHALGGLLAGYVSMQPLTRAEIAVLPILIQVRLSISVMVGACAISKEPENEYLKLHAVPGRDAIQFMCSQTNEKHSTYFQAVHEAFSADSTVAAGAQQADLLDESVYTELIARAYN